MNRFFAGATKGCGEKLDFLVEHNDDGKKFYTLRDIENRGHFFTSKRIRKSGSKAGNRQGSWLLNSLDRTGKDGEPDDQRLDFMDFKDFDVGGARDQGQAPMGSGCEVQGLGVDLTSANEENLIFHKEGKSSGSNRQSPVGDARSQVRVEEPPILDESLTDQVNVYCNINSYINNNSLEKICEDPAGKNEANTEAGPFVRYFCDSITASKYSSPMASVKDITELELQLSKICGTATERTNDADAKKQ
jgi:hypothetical protein